VVTAEVEGQVSNSRLQQLTDSHPRELTAVLRGLVERGLLVPDGRTVARVYRTRKAPSAEGPRPGEAMEGAPPRGKVRPAPHKVRLAPCEVRPAHQEVRPAPKATARKPPSGGIPARLAHASSIYAGHGSCHPRRSALRSIATTRTFAGGTSIHWSRKGSWSCATRIGRARGTRGIGRRRATAERGAAITGGAGHTPSADMSRYLLLPHPGPAKLTRNPGHVRPDRGDGVSVVTVSKALQELRSGEAAAGMVGVVPKGLEAVPGSAPAPGHAGAVNARCVRSACWKMDSSELRPSMLRGGPEACPRRPAGSPTEGIRGMSAWVARIRPQTIPLLPHPSDVKKTGSGPISTFLLQSSMTKNTK
jgi:hypothetical protein